MERISVEDAGTPPLQHLQPNFQIQDYEAFPQLHPNNMPQFPAFFPAGLEPGPLEKLYGTSGIASPPPGLSLHPGSGFNSRPSSRPVSQPGSRPGSRHASRGPPIPSNLSPSNLNDDEAFPSLDAAAKGPKRHHGKRGGHGNNKENGSGGSSHPGPSNTFADRARMSSPSPSPINLRKNPKSNRSFQGTREHSTAAMNIPPPTEVPWLETGEGVNKAYMKARQEAFKHGGARNKFLQRSVQDHSLSAHLCPFPFASPHHPP